MAAGVPARLTPAQGRRFGLTVGGAFLLLAAIAWWRGLPAITTILGVAMGLAIGIGVSLPTVTLLDNAAITAPVIPIDRLAVIALLGVVPGGGRIITQTLAAARRSPLESISAL